MVKILQVARMNKGSGVASFLMNYYRNMDRNKIQFIFLSDSLWDKDNFKNEIENLGGKIYITGHYTKFFEYCKKVWKIIKDEQPDIIHCHEATISLIALFIAKFCKVKIRIAHSHNSYMPSKIKNLVVKSTRWLFHYCATEFWACSQEAGEYLFGNKLITVINNAVNFGTYKFDKNIREKVRKNLSINDKIVIGTVGRFNYQKNYPYLLDVFLEILRKNMNVVLVICGDGEERKNIENIINENNIQDKVLLLGNVSNVNEILNSFDYFILASHYEGLPVVLIEAQANGLKCLAATKAVPSVCDIDHHLNLLNNYNKFKWADFILNSLDSRTELKREQLISSNYDIEYESKKIRRKIYFVI